MFRRQKERQRNHNQVLKLKKSLKENVALFQEIFCDDETLVLRNIEVDGIKTPFVVMYTNGMIHSERMNKNVIGPIMNCDVRKLNGRNLLDDLMYKVIMIDDVKKTSNIDELTGSIVYGDTILLVDGIDEALLINTKGWQTRAVSPPESELVVKGPREGFVETLLINISMIRRRIRSPRLKFQFKELGTKTKTRICVCYIEDIVNEKILQELEERLNQIEIDGILGSGYIEEFIGDAPFSPFRTVNYTERPDVASGNLLEGRIIILCDGAPFASILPHLFLEYFQSVEDYYDNYLYASINRQLRYFAFFLSTSVPAIYVALATYHQEMIPTPLLLSISAAREGVPFPTIVEALLMLLAFELLREGGVRLPSPYGSTISFIGALILGQAAVEAHLVSAPIVIVAALTEISNFLTPKLIGALIIVRTIFLLLSAFLGLYGYIFGVVGLFIHLMSLRSFGVPYMTEFWSLDPQDLKDTAVRAPWWYMHLRPKLIGSKNLIRMKPHKRLEKR